MKKFFIFGLVGGFFFSFFPVLADTTTTTTSTETDNIQNLTITLSPDKDTFIFKWDALPDNILKNTLGYALQWSEYQNLMTSKDPAQYLNKDNYRYVRAKEFQRSGTYYARVFTYTQSGYKGRERVLNNGSKVLKLTLDAYGEIANTEYNDANDPLDVTSTDSTTAVVTFGAVRDLHYDTYAILMWSKPNFALNDERKIIINISKSNDMSNPILTFTSPVTKASARVDGLTPETTYYAQGCFYTIDSGTKKISDCGDIDSFTTIKTLTDAQNQKNIRLEKMGLIKAPVVDIKLTVGQAQEVDISSTSSTSSSTIKSSSTTSTLSSLKKRIIVPVEKTITKVKRYVTAAMLKLTSRGVIQGIKSTTKTNTTPSTTPSN